MGLLFNLWKRWSDSQAKKEYERDLLLSAKRSLDELEKWPQQNENLDSILQLLHNNEHVPTKEFTEEEIDEIRKIFDLLPSLPEHANPPDFYRGNDDYYGVKINDPWRERHEYRALELIPNRGIFAQFIEGCAILYNGKQVDFYVDQDRKLEKRLLRILLRHGHQQDYFTMLRGEKYIDI